MRRWPPPLSVTFPPPSSTTRGLALRTFAVAFIVMVTGPDPHEKAMTPPAATALTTASEVQLSGVPEPMTRVGWLVSAAAASAGTIACPSGLPPGGAGFGVAAGAAGVGPGGAIPDAGLVSVAGAG